MIDIYSLIRNYYKYNPEGHYFDRNTLKFFGERISEMRVLKKIVYKKDFRGITHKCFVVSSLQHNCNNIRHYAYFDIYNFEEIQ